MKRVNLNLSDDLVNAIDLYAEKTGINRTSAISVLCSQALQAGKSVEVLDRLNALIKAGDVEAIRQLEKEN